MICDLFDVGNFFKTIIHIHLGWNLDISILIYYFLNLSDLLNLNLYRYFHYFINNCRFLFNDLFSSNNVLNWVLFELHFLYDFNQNHLWNKYLTDNINRNFSNDFSWHLNNPLNINKDLFNLFNFHNFFYLNYSLNNFFNLDNLLNLNRYLMHNSITTGISTFYREIKLIVVLLCKVKIITFCSQVWNHLNDFFFILLDRLFEDEDWHFHYFGHLFYPLNEKLHWDLYYHLN